MQLKFDDIPVSDHLEETVRSSMEAVRKERRKARRKHLLIGCASTAAAFAAAAVFCVANPSLAAKLPLIGGIFSDLEDDFIYPGDYSDRAQVLTPQETTEEVSEAESTEAAQPADAYTATDQGVTITASEIYCDGLSVYLSLDVYTETPLGYHYDSAGNQTPATVYLSGSSYFDGALNPGGSIGNTDFHTEQLDENHVKGMLKIDLPAPSFDGGSVHQLDISMKAFGADYDNPDGTPVSVYENPAETALWIRGDWDLSLPCTIDTSGLQAFEGLNPEDTEGNITDVYISSYQVIVQHVPVPDEWGNPMSGICAFDQDGNPLKHGSNSSPFGYDFFTLDGKQPSEIRFYVISDWVRAHKIKTEAEAAAEALGSCTIQPAWN